MFFVCVRRQSSRNSEAPLNSNPPNAQKIPPHNNVLYNKLQRSSATRTLPHRLPTQHPQQSCLAYSCDGRCAAPTTFCGHPNDRFLRLASRTLPNRHQSVVTSRSEDGLRQSDIVHSQPEPDTRNSESNKPLDLLDFQDIRSSLLPSSNSTPNRSPPEALSTFKPNSVACKKQIFRFDEENLKSLQRPDVLQSAVSDPL